MKVWEILYICETAAVAEMASICAPEWKYGTKDGIERLLEMILTTTVATGIGNGVLTYSEPNQFDLIPALCWTDGSTGPSGLPICQTVSGLYWSEWLGLEIEDKLLWRHDIARLSFIVLWYMENSGISS